MKWLVLLFPLLVAALPQQRNARSPLIRPRVSTTNSTTKAYVWRFNPDYDPDALVVESEVSGPYYSKENWNYRKVGNWLIEYAAIHLVADSDNFFEALYETPAFGRDNQEVCGLTPAGDNCIGGQLFGGTSTPFQLTNDEFNAQMVRQAIRNTFVYYRTLWSAIGDASREVSPLVGQMVLDLEKPVVVKPSGFFKVLDVIGGFIQFAGVFLPVEAIAVNIAETVVKDSVAAAKAGSTYFSISEEAAEKLAAATAKQLTTNYGKIKDSYAAGKALIGKLAAAQDDAESESPDDHMGDVLNYQAAADQFARKAMTFLESTWDDILNNGFSNGGIISQIFPGDILDLNVPATGSTLGASNDHGSGEYDNAVQQNFAYLMQRSMTQILRDHGVRIVKRGSYATSDECMNAYNDEGYDWVDDQARACFADVDTPTQFSQYFPMVTGSEILEMKTYTGGKALLGSSWGDFTFNGQEFYQSATTCTNANGLWTDAQDQYSAEWGPQYSPPRMPDGTSQTVDANQLLCAFSAPVCDYTDGTFNEACRVYKNLMRDQVYSTAKQRGVDVDVRDGDMGPCSDRDLLYFCLVSLEQGPAGSTSLADVANAYVSKIDDWYIGSWGGLAGFEIWNEGSTLGSESLSAPIKRV